MKNTIAEFLAQNKTQLSIIISELSHEFNSHEFIRKFSKHFESEYVEFLYDYKGKDPFRKVHSQIAKFLSENKSDLKICKTGKVPSQNIFGETDEIEGWKKC
jgi:hypothetical protein